MSESVTHPEGKAPPKPVKQKNEALETIIVVVEALIIALVFRTFIFQPFSIPTASMQSTMMIGDYFAASKWSYGFGRYSFPIEIPFNGRVLGFATPQRGDIAVFRNQTGEDYIKRVIGLPGDRIQMRLGRLYINDTLVEREEIGKGTDTNDSLSSVQVTIYKETLPNGVTHTIQEISDNQQLDDTPEYVVPSGHYFMMGDNRDRSADSRVLQQVGYVPLDNFIGKAEFRFFSIKNNLPPWALWEWPANVRWDRMFQSVNQ
jgi:signal peptidase I